MRVSKSAVSSAVIAMLRCSFAYCNACANWPVSEQQCDKKFSAIPCKASTNKHQSSQG